MTESPYRCAGRMEIVKREVPSPPPTLTVPPRKSARMRPEGGSPPGNVNVQPPAGVHSILASTFPPPVIVTAPLPINRYELTRLMFRILRPRPRAPSTAMPSTVGMVIAPGGSYAWREPTSQPHCMHNRLPPAIVAFPIPTPTYRYPLVSTFPPLAIVSVPVPEVPMDKPEVDQTDVPEPPPRSRSRWKIRLPR